MSKRKSRRNRRAGLSDYRQSQTGDVLHFYSGSFAVDSAEFEHVGDEAEPSAIAKRALVMVEGSHTDSNKRQHVFDKDRLLRFAANTNAFLSQGGRVPWQQDHQKTQASNLGDLEGEIIPAIITRDNLPDPRLKHLIGKLGLFTERLVARGSKAVQDVMDGKIKTLSPGIDLAADVIREISATPTPAIVGLSTFKRADAGDSPRMARFALTMEEAAAEDQDFNQMKDEFDDLSERFWRVVSDIGNAPPEEFEGEDPSAYLEQALSDYMSMISEMLHLDAEPEEVNGNDPRQRQGAGAAPVSNQQGRFSMANDLSYYSMGDVLGLAEFKRGRGPDKKPRKRRRTGAYVAGGLGGAGVIGAAGRYGTAAVQGARQNMAQNTAAANRKGLGRIFGAKSTGVSNVGAARAGAGKAFSGDVARAREAYGSARGAVGGAYGRARGAVSGAYGAVDSGARAAVKATREGYSGGIKAAEGGILGLGKKKLSRAGRLRAGVSGAAKAGWATKGGKVGVGLAAAGALGGAGLAGAAALRRRRRKNR